MGWANWLSRRPSLESQASLAITRQYLATMHPDQLRGVADTLVTGNHQLQHALRGAMGRIAELELGRALCDPEAIARDLQHQRQRGLVVFLRYHVAQLLYRLADHITP
jgi:hypothetical protein